MAIEALLFDLGKVLVDYDIELAVERFVPRSGLPRDRFEEVLRNEAWIRRYEHGQVTTEEFHQYLKDDGNLGMDFDEFQETWSAVFLPGLMIPEELLDVLKERYPLILVSNINESHASFIARQYDVFGYFDHRILSHEVGSMKPDRKIYAAAIAAAGRSPANLFFTDDREENIQAARELGIHAHRFEGVEGLLEAFQKHGIDVGDFVLPAS